MTHEQIQRALAAIVATLDEGRVLDATRDAKHLLTTLGAFTEQGPSDWVEEGGDVKF